MYTNVLKIKLQLDTVCPPDEVTGSLPSTPDRTAQINHCSSQPVAGKASDSSFWNMYCGEKTCILTSNTFKKTIEYFCQFHLCVWHLHHQTLCNKTPVPVFIRYAPLKSKFGILSFYNWQQINLIDSDRKRREKGGLFLESKSVYLKKQLKVNSM